MAGHFFCALCERRVVIDDLSEVEDFRLGTRLLCSSCDEKSTVDVIDRIIGDTSVPKTYRSIFKKYLKWRKNK